jgi:hypothetical protein
MHTFAGAGTQTAKMNSDISVWRYNSIILNPSELQLAPRFIFRHYINSIRCVEFDEHPLWIWGTLLDVGKRSSPILIYFAEVRQSAEKKTIKSVYIRGSNCKAENLNSLPYSSNPNTEKYIQNMPRPLRHKYLRIHSYILVNTGANKIMETLRNCIIEFVCVGYIERTSVGNNECSSSVCLQFVMLV